MRRGQAAYLAAKLAEALRRAGTHRVVDLCSGGGGPALAIADELAALDPDARITLTDLYPNEEGFAYLAEKSNGVIDHAGTSVDARHVPASLPGMRTMFSALHHFRPDDAQAILQSVVDEGQPFAAFEVVGRHPVVLLGMLIVVIPVMLTLPLLRPFRWAWLPLTYLVPVIPLFVMWDGIVSCLRVYSPDELRAMVARLEGGDRFDWEIGELAMGSLPGNAIYCIGTPRRAPGGAQEATS